MGWINQTWPASPKFEQSWRLWSNSHMLVCCNSSHFSTSTDQFPSSFLFLQRKGFWRARKKEKCGLAMLSLLLRLPLEILPCIRSLEMLGSTAANRILLGSGDWKGQHKLSGLARTDWYWPPSLGKEPHQGDTSELDVCKQIWYLSRKLFGGSQGLHRGRWQGHESVYHGRYEHQRRFGSGKQRHGQLGSFYLYVPWGYSEDC